jgi:putative thioredoxin
MTVLDVTEANFEQEVIERSVELPVVVDFWAEWCGPCRQLGPLLESAAKAREGQVVLAKLETDANPMIAQAFQIQGIPAVKAFSGRRVAAEFVGAQPAPAVEEFFDRLLPSEADRLVAGGSEQELRRALVLEPGRAEAAVPLARALIARGERDEAEQALEPIVGDFQADGLAARLRLERENEFAEAFAKLDRGELEPALEELLAALTADQAHREDLRRVIVGELDRLGPEHPLARSTRSRLATALF